MDYEAHEEKRELRRRRAKRVLLFACVTLFVLFVVFACIVPPESWKYYFRQPAVPARKAGELRIHFIDVGQGDSTLVELPDGKVMLVDGGAENDRAKSAVMRYLGALSIDRIDYLVVTHADGDHCGGLDEIIRYKKVVNAYLPRTYASSDIEFIEVKEGLEKENCATHVASRSVRFTSDDPAYPYDLRFLYPLADELPASDGNDDSAVLWLDYFGTNALLMGDATERTENRLLQEDGLGVLGEGVSLDGTEILKVAHHGSNASSTSAFLARLGVRSAVISCGSGNPYGHPSPSVIERLEANGAAVYRTDELGHIMLTIASGGGYSLRRIAK